MRWFSLKTIFKKVEAGEVKNEREELLREVERIVQSQKLKVQNFKFFITLNFGLPAR